MAAESCQILFVQFECLAKETEGWGQDRGVMLTTHLQPVPRLRMSGDISPLPLYATVA